MEYLEKDEKSTCDILQLLSAANTGEGGYLGGVEMCYSRFRTDLMILCVPVWVGEGILAPVPDEANCLGLVFLATIDCASL